MTTREQIIAAAEEVKANNDMFGDFSVALYTIAFEAGRVAEREECLTALGKVMVTDHSPRTYNRCLEAIRARSTK